MSMITGRRLALALVVLLLMPNLTWAMPELPDGVLRLGSTGPGVRLLQQALNLLGYELVDDGIYGGHTRWAVMHFQDRHEQLVSDGVYGARTRAVLQALLEGQDSDGMLLQDYVQEDLAEDLNLTLQVTLGTPPGLVPQAFVEENRSILKVSEDDFTVLEEFHTQLPDGLTLDLRYDRYPMAYDYFLVTTTVLNVRARPSTQSPVVRRFSYLDKVNVIQAVRGQYLPAYDSDRWYRVFWHTGNEVQLGFVFGGLGQVRAYRLEVMWQEVQRLQTAMASARLGYIFNYRHVYGMAPEHQGRNEDAFGVSRNQSAPGYYDLERTDFRYFADGQLVSILNETADFYQVRTPTFPGEYWIPRRYVSFRNVPPALKQVVVIDDIKQNEGVFQLVDDEWHLISYIFATTGIQEGSYHFETPKGHFMAIEKRPFFWYFEVGTSNISGFAPYAIRFSGGGYIHGVPVELQEGQTPYNHSPTDPRNHQEYLFTIGTTPRSRKCVRNYTSHAKFLYDWLRIGEAAFIIID